MVKTNKAIVGKFDFISREITQNLRVEALQAGRLRVRFPMLSMEFFIDIILPAALWPRG